MKRLIPLLLLLSGCRLLDLQIPRSPCPPSDPCPMVTPPPSPPIPSPSPTPSPIPLPTPTPLPTPSPSPEVCQSPPGRVCNSGEGDPDCGCWICAPRTGMKWEKKRDCAFPPPDPCLTCWSCEGLREYQVRQGHLTPVVHNGKQLYVNAGKYINDRCESVDENGSYLGPPSWFLGDQCWPPPVCSSPLPSPLPNPSPIPGPSPSPPLMSECPPLVKWVVGIHNIMNGNFQPSEEVVSGGYVVLDSTPRFRLPNYPPDRGGPCNSDHPCGRECEDPRGGVFTVVSGDPGNSRTQSPGPDSGYQLRLGPLNRGSHVIRLCPLGDLHDGENPSRRVGLVPGFVCSEVTVEVH